MITLEEERERLSLTVDPATDELPEYGVRTQTEQPQGYTALVTVFMFIYPFGATAFMLYHIAAYTIFIRKISRNNKNYDADCTIPVYRNKKATTPMLIGLFNPAIILPECDYTDAQLRAVLLHELTHLRRKDIFVKWLGVLACSIHWFNPIVWFVRRETDRACELACDESVIRNLDANCRQNYGDTLIYIATDTKTPHAIISTTMCEEKRALKERLGAIMKSKKHSRLALAVSTILLLSAILTACVLGAGRSGNQNLIEFEAVYRDVNEHSFSVEFKRGEILYTCYIVDDMLQAAGGTRGLKEIGFAIGDFSGTVREGQKDEYRIFEREGYSIDEFIVVQDDGFMNPAVIYIGNQIPPDRTGPISLGTYTSDDGQTQAVLLTAVPLSPFTSLTFGGRTIEDSAFTAEVWNTLRFDDLVEIDVDGRTWESSERLVFCSGDEYFYLNIVPNDEGWVSTPTDTPGYTETIAYYSAPAGTYDALTSLLTYYIADNFMYDITPQIMSDLIYSSEDLQFILYREADYYVQSSSVGHFMDEWDLDSWIEFVMPDGTERSMENVIRVLCTSSDIQIYINLDYLDVIVFYEWGNAYYKISQDTADTVQRQFKEFQELAFFTVDWGWGE